MELVFVTNNPNKLNEIQSLVSHDIAIKSLKDINFHGEIDETELTLEGNALLKADTYIQNLVLIVLLMIQDWKLKL